jgi:hypothetical protein
MSDGDLTGLLPGDDIALCSTSTLLVKSSAIEVRQNTPCAALLVCFWLVELGWFSMLRIFFLPFFLALRILRQSKATIQQAQHDKDLVSTK